MQKCVCTKTVPRHPLKALHRHETGEGSVDRVSVYTLPIQRDSSVYPTVCGPTVATAAWRASVYINDEQPKSDHRFLLEVHTPTHPCTRSMCALKRGRLSRGCRGQQTELSHANELKIISCFLDFFFLCNPRQQKKDEWTHYRRMFAI